MTDASSETAPTQSAKELNALAADWLQRRDFWVWNAADQAALDAWLAESWAHRVAYYRLEAGWRRTDRLAALRRHSHGTGQAVRGEKFVPFLIRATAACALLAVVGLAVTTYTRPPEGRTYSTSIGGRETIAFRDGSQIELNTDTSVRVLDEAGKRQVWLDRGEAYFDITHDSARPFTVWIADRRVTDVGTKFDIRQSPNHLELSVIEGRVSVASAQSTQSSQPLLLSQGDVLVATADAMSVVKRQPQTMKRDLGWRRGMLVFNNIPLSEAVAEFNRYSAEKLVVADDATARIPVSGTFPTSGIHDFVQLARSVLGLRAEHRNGETVISLSRH